MKIDLYRTSSQAAARSSRSMPGFNQIQLGDELIVYARTSVAGAVQSRSAVANIERGERLTNMEEDNLHLVVQIGSRFQQDYPEIPVIVNKGRYLIVNVDPNTAKEIVSRSETCYMIRTLEGSEVIFDVVPPRATRSAPEAWVKNLADQVSQTRIANRLGHLVSFRTRNSTSDEFRRAAEWTAEELAGMGYSVQHQQISVNGSNSWNVIAEKIGAETGPRNVVLVVGHLDSINISGGPAADAPGADDNGSGSTGVLEIAEILKNHNGRHDLRFILFGGEEQGLFGSKHYVESLSAAERSRIRSVINMDMIATVNTNANTVLLEGAPLSQSLIDGLADAAATYTALTVQTSLDPFNSDHVPFIKAGIPAVLSIEGADSANHNVHTINDKLDHINFPLMIDILKMNVAFTAKALEMQPPTAASNGAPVAVCKNSTGGMRNTVQFSGCYKYNGGASARVGRGFVDRSSGQCAAALHDPIYRLDELAYVESPEELGLAQRSSDQLRFTLSIDIDGIDPLNVVSGTVAAGPAEPNTPFPHFIGRVTSNASSMTGRVLTVQDFSFRWPESNNRIDRLTVELNESALMPIRAQVVFNDTSQARDFGPYVLTQESMYFREVEIDVDREINAVEVEPVSTLVHPDRPADLPAEDLTLETAFAKAGVRITRSSGSGTIVDTVGAGTNRRWSYTELHDSMQLHWEAFKNKPQWKMWLFLAELADDDGLGGVMFDGEINEPGGVDRQGTAIFTRCPYFHTEAGSYIQANPPSQEAVRRELFFNLIHETGHAFNLAHSFQKEQGMGWEAPMWMPMKTNNQALSWMNYPDSATPGGAGANASWFYKRFRFRFDESELLFLRHAPETYVQMGAAGWFQNHGRVARINLDSRLKLIVRSRKQIYEFGEPVIVELRLSNESDHAVTVHRNLDPSDGLVEMAITTPDGKRLPFLPVDHTRSKMAPYVLERGKEPLYQAVDLTMGSFGFSFKKPGAYRIEASYTNIDGGCAACVLQVYVRPPANYDVVPIVNELFNARLGIAMYVEGTRVLDDVNDRIDWVLNGLNQELGDQNPISKHLTTVRYKPLAKPGKVVVPTLEASRRVKVLGEEPDRFVAKVAPVVLEDVERTADTMGHIWFSEVVNTFTEAALEAGEPIKAKQAQEQMVELFKKRNVVKSVVDRAEGRINEIESRQ